MPCFPVGCGSMIMEVDCPTYKADLDEVRAHYCLSVRLARLQHRKFVPDVRQRLMVVLASSLLVKTSQ